MYDPTQVARPYALLNCGVAALFMAHATLYGILELELPALVRGDIDSITPRARRTELPWPALDAMLPPTWSLYMPLVPADDDQFPEVSDAAQKMNLNLTRSRRWRRRDATPP